MISLQDGKFFSGTSGLVLEEPNKKSFPAFFQDKSRLTYYSSLFNSIEINSSFYKIPQYNTCKRWSEETGQSFLFTFKIWKGITHVENFNVSDLVKFVSAVSGIGVKKGCLLIQYPAKSTVRLTEIERLIKTIRNLDPTWKIAVEIRNLLWLTSDFFGVLGSHHATLVLHDRQKAEMIDADFTSSFIYLRYHGPKGDFRGSYSLEFLQMQAAKITKWTGKGSDVCVYFNNTMGDAVRNLKTLNAILHS